MLKNGMTVYYAHPMNIYDKPEEAEDISYLESLGYNVLNPNQPQHQTGCKVHPKSVMAYFGELVNKCDSLAFRAFPDGKIGAGICYEVKKNGDRPLYEISDDGNLIPITKEEVEARGLSIEETRRYLGRSG